MFETLHAQELQRLEVATLLLVNGLHLASLGALDAIGRPPLPLCARNSFWTSMDSKRWLFKAEAWVCPMACSTVPFR